MLQSWEALYGLWLLVVASFQAIPAQISTVFQPSLEKRLQKNAAKPILAALPSSHISGAFANQHLKLDTGGLDQQLRGNASRHRQRGMPEPSHDPASCNHKAPPQTHECSFGLALHAILPQTGHCKSAGCALWGTAQGPKLVAQLRPMATAQNCVLAVLDCASIGHVPHAVPLSRGQAEQVQSGTGRPDHKRHHRSSKRMQEDTALLMKCEHF